MDAIARFTAYDWIAIVLAFGMIGTIAALQASVFQEWRRLGAVGLILMAGGFGVVLLLVDPGESVIFGVMDVSPASEGSKGKSERLSQQLVREDGKKPGTDASGPGDGDGGKRDGEAERQQAEKAEKAEKSEREDAEGGQGGGSKTAKVDKKKKGGAGTEKEGAKDNANAGADAEAGDEQASDGAADERGGGGDAAGSGDGQGPGKGTKSAGAGDGGKTDKTDKSIADCEKCPVLVRVGRGSYQAGSSNEERGHRNHEGPVRRITIGRAFLIGKYEVTREQFAHFLEQSKHPQPQGCVVDGKYAKDRGFARPGYEQGPDHPAVCVSWYDAKAYVTWLSRLTGQGYRLPSEAEWEFAARAGGRGNFPWGESIRPDDANFNTMKAGTLPVGKFEPNRSGLFDISGNVWELVEDCWTPNHVEMPANGTAVKIPGCLQRTMRGGAWYNGPRYVRSASRWSNPASAAGNGVGFRVARDIRVQTADAD